MEDSPADPLQRALARSYAEYRRAMTAWLAAAKVGHAGTSEQAAERLLHARVGLYRALVDTGWSPPPGVMAQLDRDVALVEAPADFEALLTV